MAQAGLHALVGAAVKKWMPGRQWLLLGIVLGSFFPDMDNLLVAIATVARLSTAAEAMEVYHRTFTHSIFTILFIWAVFWLVGTVRKQERWTNFGLGFGVGVGLHILLDFVLWFNGVWLFWPLGSEINFWTGVTAPGWLKTFLDPAEFLFFALFLFMLRYFALKYKTDAAFLKTLNVWMGVMVVLFVVFTPLAYIMTQGYLTLFGALYLFALFATFGVTLRMQETVSRFGQPG